MPGCQCPPQDVWGPFSVPLGQPSPLPGAPYPECLSPHKSPSQCPQDARLSFPVPPPPLLSFPQLALPDGTVTADHVVSALPAAGRVGVPGPMGSPRVGKGHGGWHCTHPLMCPLLPALAEVLPPEAEQLAQELRRIPAVPVAVVNLQYQGVTLPVTVRAAPTSVPQQPRACLASTGDPTLLLPRALGTWCPPQRTPHSWASSTTRWPSPSTMAPLPAQCGSR